MTRKPRTEPRRADLIDAVDNHVTGLDAMIGRWFNSIPAAVRAELHTLREPLEALLIKLGRRGQRRGG
jgi:hypothetical protein